MKQSWTILALAGALVLADAQSASAQRLGRALRGQKTGFSNLFRPSFSNYGNRYDNSYYGSRSYSPYSGRSGYSYGTMPFQSGYTRSFYSTSPTYYPSPTYYTSPTVYTTPTVDSSYSVPSNSIVPTTYIQPDTTTASRQDYATVNVSVPTTETMLWIESTPMTKTGTERVFYSPTLESGQAYSYTIKAQWMIDGRAVEQTKKVQIRAGQLSKVDFREGALDVIPEPIRIK